MNPILESLFGDRGQELEALSLRRYSEVASQRDLQSQLDSIESRDRIKRERLQSEAAGIESSLSSLGAEMQQIQKDLTEILPELARHSTPWESFTFWIRDLWNRVVPQTMQRSTSQGSLSQLKERCTRSHSRLQAIQLEVHAFEERRTQLDRQILEVTEERDAIHTLIDQSRLREAELVDTITERFTTRIMTMSLLSLSHQLSQEGLISASVIRDTLKVRRCGKLLSLLPLERRSDVGPADAPGSTPEDKVGEGFHEILNMTGIQLKMDGRSLNGFQEDSRLLSYVLVKKFFHERRWDPSNYSKALVGICTEAIREGQRELLSDCHDDFLNQMKAPLENLLASTGLQRDSVN